MNYFTMLDHLHKVVPLYTPPYLGSQTDFNDHCEAKGGVWYVSVEWWPLFLPR